MNLLALIILIGLLMSGLPTWGYSRNWGYSPSYVLWFVLIAVQLHLFLGIL